jgi:selenocysteine-specific elongation factor
MLEGELAPGATDFIQLRLEAPLLARAGDHIVLRSYSPVHTIGGGLVLEPMAPKRKRLTNELRYVLSTVHDSTEAHFSAVALADRPPSNAVLPVLTGLSPALVGRAVAQDVRLLQFDDRVFDAKQVTHCTDIMTAVVRTFHAQHPLEDGIDREALRRATGGSTDIFEVALQRAIDGGQLQNRGAAIAQPDFRAAPSATDLALIERLRSVFETAALQAPSTAELAADMVTPRLLSQLRHLEREGSLVRVSNDRWLAAGALHRAVALLRAHLPVGQQVDIADFRNILGLSRKHLIPLLEFLDRSGVTVRRGDGRVLIPVDELAFVSSQETAAPLVPEP